MSTEKERVKRLVGSGLSETEANRWVYGWSEPTMKTFWLDVMKTRPKDALQFTQKEAFKTILKTVFGKDYVEGQKFELPHAAYLEVVEIVVEGILNGHVATRAIKLVSPTKEDLFHKARSEFKRLLQDDPDFRHIKHSKE